MTTVRMLEKVITSINTPNFSAPNARATINVGYQADRQFEDLAAIHDPHVDAGPR